MAIRMSDLSPAAQKLVKKTAPKPKPFVKPAELNQADTSTAIKRDANGKPSLIPPRRQLPLEPFGFILPDTEGSDLEVDFLKKLKVYCPKMFDGRFGPIFREWWFAHPQRQWRFDFAFPLHKIAIEVEGGLHNGGRHVTGTGYEADLDKYNSAVESGWQLYRAGPKIIGKGMTQFARTVFEALTKREAELQAA